MEQEQEQQQEQQQEMLGVLSLVPALDQRVAVFRCPIKPQLFSTWLITAQPVVASQSSQLWPAPNLETLLSKQCLVSVVPNYSPLPSAVSTPATGSIIYIYPSL